MRDLFSALVWVMTLSCAWVAGDAMLRHFSVEPWIFLMLWASVGVAVAGSALRNLRRMR